MRQRLIRRVLRVLSHARHAGRIRFLRPRYVRGRGGQRAEERLSNELAVQPLRSFRPGAEVSNEGLTDQEMSGVSNITTRSRRRLFFYSNQVLRQNRFYGSGSQTSLATVSASVAIVWAAAWLWPDQSPFICRI